MRFFTKKRIVLFLLFIFPLICFLILSTGENNFTKLPVVTKGIIDIKDLKPNQSVTFKNHVTVVCFLGNEVRNNKTNIFNLNEKIYKKFFDYKKFQVVGIYTVGKEDDILEFKLEIAEFADMQNWKFVSLEELEIKAIFESFNSDFSLVNFASNKAFIIDKDGNLRGRTNDEDTKGGKLYGYNMKSISELKDKMKDDISVLFYEYYAAFKIKNQNKADRKEVGL